MSDDNTTSRLWFVVRQSLVVCAIGISVHCTYRPPETPANALLAWQRHVLDADADAAWDRLCSRMKSDVLAEPIDDSAGKRFAELTRFLRFRGQFYTDRETIYNGNTSWEPITVEPRDAESSNRDEMWIATLVKDGQEWKVCGLKPLFELSKRELAELRRHGFQPTDQMLNRSA